MRKASVKHTPSHHVIMRHKKYQLAAAKAASLFGFILQVCAGSKMDRTSSVVVSPIVLCQGGSVRWSSRHYVGAISIFLSFWQ